LRRSLALGKDCPQDLDVCRNALMNVMRAV